MCGPALKPIALRVVYEVAQVVDVPVIGIGGISTVEDVLDLLAVGASAVGVGVAALADPMLPVRLADELADACRARGASNVADLVGTALPGRVAPPSTKGAEYSR
jgi:dihydroorotate dehydrogenase (NAD+) catalytic subunit